MKVNFILVGLIFLALVRGDTTEEPESSETSEEKAKKLLQEDDITLKIVEELVKLKWSPEVLALMHLIFNQLLVARQLFSHESVQLQAMPQFPQLEFDKINETLSSTEEQTAFKLEHDLINTEIANSINAAFKTTYEGGGLIKPGQLESLATILPNEEVISPLRTTLISQFLGTLMLSNSNAFGVFDEDKISYSP